jgi:hypothetical protein
METVTRQQGHCRLPTANDQKLAASAAGTPRRDCLRRVVDGL